MSIRPRGKEFCGIGRGQVVRKKLMATCKQLREEVRQVTLRWLLFAREDLPLHSGLYRRPPAAFFSNMQRAKSNVWKFSSVEMDQVRSYPGEAGCPSEQGRVFSGHAQRAVVQGLCAQCAHKGGHRHRHLARGWELGLRRLKLICLAHFALLPSEQRWACYQEAPCLPLRTELLICQQVGTSEEKDRWLLSSAMPAMLGFEIASWF